MSRKTNDKGILFNNIFPHTELGVDVKLLTRKPGRLPIGKELTGLLRRDSEEHLTFTEFALSRKIYVQRNPAVYKGRCINVRKRDDNTLYPTFNRPRYSEEFTFQDFCRKAAEELLMVAGSYDKTCLVKESQKD